MQPATLIHVAGCILFTARCPPADDAALLY
jgi:hypothetical protein